MSWQASGENLHTWEVKYVHHAIVFSSKSVESPWRACGGEFPKLQYSRHVKVAVIPAEVE